MQRHLLSLTILAIVFYPSIGAAQTDFSSVDQFLKSVLTTNARLSIEARGDVDGDGNADWTALLHRQKVDQSPTYQLYILLRTPQGGYHVAEKSKEEEIAGMGCCWVEDLRIERSSIYIQSNAKTATTMEAATHQFKFYKGEWRLVGVKIYYIDHSADVTTETDMNLLTGAVVEKRQQGDRKARISRRSRKFGRSLLKDFDFLNTFGTD